LDNCEDLPDNKVIAEKRLASTTAKLKTENKFEDYNNVFEDWLKGVIEEVPAEEVKNGEHFFASPRGLKVHMDD
jgi:hypothetical protein